MSRFFDTARVEDVEMNYLDDNDSHSNSDEGSLQSWINWFCSLTGHEYYVEVPEEFIEDEFNLTGLSTIVPYYNEALEMLLDIDPEDNGGEDGVINETYHDMRQRDGVVVMPTDVGHDNDDKRSSQHPTKLEPNKSGTTTWVDPNIIEPYAMMLYGLIHQRYLLTRNGLRIMAERYSQEQFGVCPRYYCYKCPVIPCGRYDEVARESVRLYCPSCMDLYAAPSSLYQNVDGAHFGTTYAHFLFQTYPELVAKPNHRIYQPRIYGFKISAMSPSAPRMQWLRMIPDEAMDADEGDVEDGEDEPEDMNVTHETRKAHTQGDPEPEGFQLTGWRVKNTSLNNLLRRFF